MKPRAKYAAILGLAGSIAALVLVLYGIWPQPVHASPPPAVLDKLKLTAGSPAVPDVTFVDAAGRPVKLSSFKGRYVLLNIWATWCGPCIIELPELVRLRGKLPADRFAVLALDMEKVDAGQGQRLPRPACDQRSCRLHRQPIFRNEGLRAERIAAHRADRCDKGHEIARG